MKSCIYCQGTRLWSKGKTKSGTSRFKCRDCGKTFTGTKKGRPLIGDNPMTSTERSQNSRKNKLFVPCEIRWTHSSLDAFIVRDLGDKFEVLIKDDPLFEDQILSIAKEKIFPKQKLSPHKQ